MPTAAPAQITRDWRLYFIDRSLGGAMPTSGSHPGEEKYMGIENPFQPVFIIPDKTNPNFEFVSREGMKNIVEANVDNATLVSNSLYWKNKNSYYIVNIQSTNQDYNGWILFREKTEEDDTAPLYLLRNPKNQILYDILPLNLEKSIKWLHIEVGDGSLLKRVSWNNPLNKNMELVLGKALAEGKVWFNNYDNYLNLLKFYSQNFVDDKSFKTIAENNKAKICPLVYLKPEETLGGAKRAPSPTPSSDGPVPPTSLFSLGILGNQPAGNNGAAVVPVSNAFLNTPTRLDGLVTYKNPPEGWGQKDWDTIKSQLYTDCGSPSSTPSSIIYCGNITNGKIINNLDKVFPDIEFPKNCDYSYKKSSKIYFPPNLKYCNSIWPPILRTYKSEDATQYSANDIPYIESERLEDNYQLKINRPYNLCYNNQLNNLKCKGRCGQGGSDRFPFAQFDQQQLFPCQCDPNCHRRGDCCMSSWELTKQALCKQGCNC